jgi:hypothetical protein
MGILPSSLEAKRKQIARLASRRAFDSYLRYGQVPEVYAHLVEVTGSEQKFLDFCQPDLSRKAIGDPRPTRFYTWRTTGDDRVRSAHAANEGRIFSWSDPPPTGHPGTEHNCRCWPEPYYGDPAMSDQSLLLTREVRAGTDDEPWGSIETVTRPDGSLAEALLFARDGARVHSVYTGDQVIHEATLDDGRRVTIANANGIQTFFYGENRIPLLHSRWTPKGPVVKRPRLAFSGDFDDLDLDDFDDLTDLGSPLDQDLDILPIGPFTSDLDDPFSDAAWYIGAATIVATSNRRATRDGVPAVGYKVWEKNDALRLLPIFAAILTAEQIEQSCKRLRDAQDWTDEAVRALAAMKPSMTPQDWGIAVHKGVKQRIDALKREAPELYADLSAERSFDPSSDTFSPDATYGQLGSWRLDVVEQVSEDLFCVYDIKTGKRGIYKRQRDGAFASIEKLRRGATVLVIEVRPTE